MTQLSRRDLLRGAAAGALIAGWDPVSRSWATAADRRRRLDRIPDLDGVLLTDTASRRLAADDYGHFVHHEPVAVLRPASVEDIVKLVCSRANARSASRCAGRRTAATGSRKPPPGS